MKSFFHLPFDEMIITLDGVSRLFHLSLASNFFIALLMNEKTACMAAETCLGVTPELVLDDLRADMSSISVSLGSRICINP